MIDFREIQREEQRLLEEAAKQTRKKVKEPQTPPSEGDQQKIGEEEQTKLNSDQKSILSTQLEVIEAKRKEDNMATTSARYRNILLSQIFAIIAIFGIYFIITIALRINYFNNVKLALGILQKVASREPYLSALTFFSKDDFTTGTITYNPDNKSEPLFWKYYWLQLDNELQKQMIYSSISGLFPDLASVMDITRTNEFCTLIYFTSTEISHCLTMFDGILSQGMEIALNIMMRRVSIAYYNLELTIAAGQNGTGTYLADQEILSLLDLHEADLTSGTLLEFGEVEDHASKLFDAIANFDRYDFAILMILLMLVILVAFRLFLNRFEFSLWKTKRTLGILPTKYMAEHITKIKSLIKRLS